MSTLSWSAILSAGLISILSPLALRPWLAGMGIMDVPNHRSSHTETTLRGGGVAQLLGVAVGGALAAMAAPTDSERQLLLLILAAAILMGILGLVEDLYGIPALARAGLQLIVGAALALTLAGLSGTSFLWVPVSAFAFAAYVNFANFMDGVNGISSLHGLAVGSAYALLGAMEQEPWLITIGLLSAFCFLTFLPWNLTPPGMFLGDVGSYLLGATMAGTALAAVLTGVSPFAALAPLTIYVADTVTTLARRMLRRERIFEAHRSHTYQRLANAGLKHMTVAGTVAVFTITVSALGLLAAAGLIALWVSAILALSLVSAYLLLPRYLRSGEMSFSSSQTNGPTSGRIRS